MRRAGAGTSRPGRLSAPGARVGTRSPASAGPATPPSTAVWGAPLTLGFIWGTGLIALMSSFNATDKYLIENMCFSQRLVSHDCGET